MKALLIGYPWGETRGCWHPKWAGAGGWYSGGRLEWGFGAKRAGCPARATEPGSQPPEDCPVLNETLHPGRVALRACTFMTSSLLVI